MKRVLAVLLLLAAGCGGDSGSDDTSSDADGEPVVTTATPDGTSADDSESAGSTGGQTSDGTRIFVVSGSGVDIVDLDAETQEVFVDGYDGPYGLVLADGDLWFSEAEGSLVSVDASSGAENGNVALPGPFFGLAVTEDMAWVMAGYNGDLVGVERDGMAIRGTTVAPEGTYYDIVAASGDDVWINGGDFESRTTIRKVDPTTVTVGDPVDTGVIADSMVFGFDALWIGGTKPGTPDGLTAPLSSIAKLDPSTGEVLNLFEIGGHGDGEVVVEVAFGSLWATQGLDAVLIKFDPATGDELGRVEVGSGAAGIPYPMLVTSDAIWVVNTTDSQALSFDPETLEFKSGIDMPYFGGAFAFVP